MIFWLPLDYSMNKKEAKEQIEWWFKLPRKLKDRNWDKTLPYINNYPDIYYERTKHGKVIKTSEAATN